MRERSGGAVPGFGNDGSEFLRAERIFAARPAVERSGDEVHADGSVQLGHSGVWIFDFVWASRLDEPGGDSGSDSPAARAISGNRSADFSRAGDRGCRNIFQD